jgi:NAD(P)-dependent dehydrogenase (short-subunit alcohol dehydrogenase family)
MTANETLNKPGNGLENGVSNIVQDSATEAPRPTTSIQLEGKVIAITGANRGIGLGIANSCLVNGAAHVYSIDIGETEDDFMTIAKRFPGQLHALKADVTNEENVTNAIDRIIEEAGSIHGMVVNAGRTKHKAALDFTKEEIDQLFSINLYGSFFCARVAARAFIKLGVKGSIVFTASMASYRPNKRVPSAGKYRRCTTISIRSY